jgi:hypothetical protein
MWAMSSVHSSTMTILELNRLVLAQDARWADILTYAQSTRNPAAPAGVTFFRRTWRPVLDDYFQNVAGRYAPEAPVPSGVMNGLLSRMSNVVYPAARQVGLSDRSFLFPDITLDPTSPSTVAGAERYVDKNTNFDQHLGEQKRATEGGTSTPTNGGVRSAPRSISPIAIGLGVVGVLGVVAIATRH